MCYDSYERLLRARLHRAAKESGNPEREQAAPETHRRPEEPATSDKVEIREKEPA